MIIDKVREYFLNFCSVNKEGLYAQFSEVIVLTDWDTQASGIEEVMDAFDNIWSNLSNIRVKIDSIDVLDNRAYCSIEIEAEELADCLRVIDIIDFNTSGKIASITAYKR